MNDNIAHALERELKGVRLSEDSVARIAMNARRGRRSHGLRDAAKSAVAIAASIAVLVGAAFLTRGMLLQKPGGDGSGINPAAAKPDGAPYAEQADDVWVLDGVYHTSPDCAMAAGAVRTHAAEAAMQNLTPCEICAAAQPAATAEPLEQEALIPAEELVPTPSPLAENEQSAINEEPITEAAEAPLEFVVSGETDGQALISENSEQESEAFWATDGGKYYHTDQYCSDMTNAHAIGEADALREGKWPCPVCTAVSIRSADNEWHYWATDGGKYYHVTADCSGMKNAILMSENDAIAQGKDLCPVCLESEEASFVVETTFWATDSSEYYHTNQYCSDMKDARQLKESTAVALGKTLCPTCALESSSDAREMDADSGIAETAAEENEEVYWATDGGKYYHNVSSCSGMLNAHLMLESAAISEGKTKCPVCLGGSGEEIPVNESVN